MPRLLPLVTLLMLVNLVGCGQHPVIKNLHTYHQRLANVLEVESEPAEIDASLRYPDAAQLRVPIDPTFIPLRQLYALGHCPVKMLIAERNTALGKLQAPSTRYVYELRLIEGLQQCITLTDDPEQVELLQGWLTTKQAQLPLVWADLVQNSDEIKTTLSSNQNMFAKTDNQVMVTYLRALERVVQPQKALSAAPGALEDALNIMRQDAIIAELWRTQKALTQGLHHITGLLEAHPIVSCQKPGDSQQLDYLSNVFRRYFIDYFQPLGSDINRYHYQLAPILQQLIEHPQITPGFSRYLAEYLSQFDAFQLAVREHVEFWQALFKRCNSQPPTSV